LPLRGCKVQRPELIDADDPAVVGWVVVEVQDPAHLGDEVGVGGGLPGGRGLPRHPALAQDASQRLPRQFGDDALAQQVLAQRGQRPGGEAGDAQSAGDVRAIVQIQEQSCSPILRPGPPLGFGSSASNPRSLNAWITSRT
jgi:hypothetical protein